MSEELTPKQKSAMQLMWDGCKQRTICEQLKIKGGELYQWTKTRAWQEEWRNRVLSPLELNSPKAVEELQRLALQGESEAVRLKALNSWLDRANMVGEGDRTDVNLRVSFENIETSEFAE